MLDSNSAKKFAIETIRKSGLHPIQKKFLQMHSLSVMKTSLEIARVKKVSIDKETIIISAWLHDIGQTVSQKGHAEVSITLTEEKFGKLPDRIYDCIANHGDEKEPKTEEGKIIQLADKLSILQDTKGIAFLFEDKKNLQKSSDFLKMVSEDLIKVLQKFDWNK